MDGETPSLPKAARGMDGETPSLPMAAQSPTARVQETSEPSIKAAAKHQGRVEAKGVRSGLEPSLSRTEFPEPSVSCRSRSASKSRSFSAMGSAASPRRNSLLLSRILCISKVIRSWGVAQELSSKASPSIGQTVTGHKLPELLGIENAGFEELEETGLILRASRLQGDCR